MADKGGFFPWKVQEIVSTVYTAIDEVIEASQEPTTRRRVPRKQDSTQRNVAETTKDVVMEDVHPGVPKQTKQEAASLSPIGPQRQKFKGSQKKAEPELVSEKADSPRIVEFTKAVIEPKFLSLDSGDNDWELLSERASTASMGGTDVFVSRAGSLRSVGSGGEDETKSKRSASNNSSQTTLSVPFKIQRTLSSSTIDSQDNALGPSGQGVLGVDYVEHIVLPADTLQGICIAYKVSASSLRRANHFTGHSLHSAPRKLVIPMSKQALRTGFIRVQDTDSKEYKLHYFQAELPNINAAEAKVYLELADWQLHEAIQSAKDDREWEKEEADDNLTAGQIGVKFNFMGGLKIRGIGLGRGASKKEVAPAPTEAEGLATSEDYSSKQRKTKQKVVVHSKLPSIATKSVFAEDLYKAAPEHCNFGLELKPLPRKQGTEICN